MGDTQATLFQPDFNRSIHVESRRERLSADGGAILLREIFHRLGLDGWLTERLADPRDAARTVHASEELLRTLVLLQGQGWSEQAAVTGLRQDPAFRLAVSSRRRDRALRPAGESREPEGLCSQPTLSRYLEGLASGANRAVLEAALREGADRRHGLRHQPPLREATLDLDSLAVEVWGHQPGSAYNGHFRCRCYHPLVLRWDRGDFLAARLRPGNAHTADGGHEFALPSIRWARQRVRKLWLRVDAGFPSPTFLQTVEGEGVWYVARLRTNRALERMAAPYLRRPPGRPPKEGRTWLYELTYGAGTWERERRVVLVVLERPERKKTADGAEQLHLFLDHFFLLTNAPAERVSAEELLARYRGRGRAEKDFGDWKSTLRLRLSSSPRPHTHYRGRKLRDPGAGRDSFAVNEAWLLLTLLAANLLDLGCALYHRATGKRKNRQSFRQWLLKVAVRVTLGGHRVTVILGAERAPAWTALWQELVRAYPVRGSPRSKARPLPA